ncbi:hypothetical protein M8J77_004491 [Diaphorina citri]|nr:hypothetical protein M8J77_004491 [Diaphorina citri]
MNATDTNNVRGQRLAYSQPCGRDGYGTRSTLLIFSDLSGTGALNVECPIGAKLDITFPIVRAVTTWWTALFEMIAHQFGNKIDHNVE